jgi:hypothetical protein
VGLWCCADEVEDFPGIIAAQTKAAQKADDFLRLGFEDRITMQSKEGHDCSTNRSSRCIECMGQLPVGIEHEPDFGLTASSPEIRSQDFQQTTLLEVVNHGISLRLGRLEIIFGHFEGV